MDVVLGVDGGNTKTVALVARTDGTVVGLGRAGCADVHGAESPEAALGEIVAAVDDALRAVPGGNPNVVGAGFSLAGADWPEDFEYLRQRLGQRFPTPALVVVNDAIGILRCGSQTWTGVAVAVGTWAAIGSRNDAGDVFHRGWWPDAMGGEPIAEAALSAVYRADLGLGPPTTLTARVCEAFGVDSADELLYVLNRLGEPPSRLGPRLTPITLDEADGGDAVAERIVLHQAGLIGAAAKLSAERVGLGGEGSLLVLGGGVLRHPARLLVQAIADAAGAPRVVRTAFEPAVGALSLAFDLLKVDVRPDEIAARLTDAGLSASG
jgi:N-acetylglucosamine kinase-like BadF-type ATPase